MRIIFDVLRDGLGAINTAADQFAAAQQQVATSKRINIASDDPLGSQVAITERTTMANIDAYTRSAGSAASRLASVDSVLNTVIDKVSSGIVTATAARGSYVDATSRAASAAQIRSLRESLVGDLNTTFQGSSLFAGTKVDAAAYAQVGGAWTYQGDAAQAKLEVDKGRLVSVTFNGQSIAQGADATDVFTAMDDLATAIEAGDNDAIGTGIDALHRAFDRASRAQGQIGADERTVDDATTLLATRRVAADQRRSKIEDVNMADAITRLNQADSAYRAALGAVSSAERLSLLDYLR